MTRILFASLLFAGLTGSAFAETSRPAKQYNLPSVELQDKDIPAVAFDMPLPDPGSKKPPTVAFDMPLPDPGSKKPPTVAFIPHFQA